MRIGLYVSHFFFGRFARKTVERAAFIVTMSAQVFWSQACVALRLLCSLLDVHSEKSQTSSTSFGKGKLLEGYVSLVKYKYRSGDAARNSMFIVAEAGVFWVCKQWYICIIRSIRGGRVGIPWIGVGASGKAAFMLVREVSAIGADMVNNIFRLRAENSNL
jgi:hypothetical protein